MFKKADFGSVVTLKFNFVGIILKIDKSKKT